MLSSANVVSFKLRYTTWVAPRNVDKVIPFMGLAGYYNMFIKIFS